MTGPSLAVLTFSGWNWLAPAGGLVLAGALILFWSYRAAPAGALRWACLALKTAALAALALCLLEPLWFGERARPGANLFAVLADNSQSLQIKDPGSPHTRGEELRQLLDPAHADWLGTLGDTFELRRYVFDTRLQASADFHELSFDGRATALGSALRSLADRFQGRPLAGILLFTDGNATDLPSLPADLAHSPPIYPVVLGSAAPVRDIALGAATATQSAFEDAPVAVQADATAAGFTGRAIRATLTDEAGKLVQEQTMTAAGDGDQLAFRFQLKPAGGGLLFYRVAVGAAGAPAAAGGGAALSPPSSEQDEATMANNSRVLAVNRGGGPYRILYVGGHPGWEYKFLNRAAQEDKELDLIGLIRVARSEPKFDYRGRVGESSNPLYRGFSNQSPEEVQRYDQPVLVRLNTRDALELRSGFPAVPEDLYGYDAVIVDDVESAFFSPVQSMLLQKFVSERGGGFLMMGGMQSFREGGYLRTPIGDMLPVYLDGATGSPPPPEGGWHFQLTREGLLQPWARLRDNEPAERARRDAMTGFEVVNWVRGTKPGASIIAALHDASGGEVPAIAVQRFGRGRTAALTVGDLWRWGLSDDAAHQDLDKSWRQMLRWLTSDVPQRVELTVEPVEGDPNHAVKLQVRARDAKFQPMDEASVAIEVAPVLFDSPPSAENKPVRILADPALTEPGLYEATYVPRLTGGYRATAVVANAVGAEVGRAAAGWSSDLAADEFRSLTPNRSLLETIAQRTGGRIISAAELNSFARQLPQAKAPIMDSWSYPLWHTPEIFGFALLCLLAEWGLRRWKGMP
jgi:uncharacterized membrane protein